MYQHLRITITCIADKLCIKSLVPRTDGVIEEVEHVTVLKIKGAGDVTQELALLTILLNQHVHKLECAVVGFHIDFKPGVLVATYLLRAH
jgi:hypothetical protein